MKSAEELVEDSTQFFTQRSQHALDGPRRPLLEAPPVDRTKLSWNRVASLQILGVDRALVYRPEVRHVAQFDRFEAIGDGELHRRPRVGGSLHEVRPDWQRNPGTVRLPANRRRLIEANPYTDHDRTREADKPGVPKPVS